MCSVVLFGSAAHSQENFTFSGMEASNFDTIDLSVGGALWTTERGAVPGYFSAVANAVYINASDNSNVNGYIKKYGDQSFEFPVGSGADLRTLSISAPGQNTDVYATAWIAGDPGTNMDATAPNPGTHPVTAVQFPILSVSDVGQWDWQVGDANNLGPHSTGTGAGLTISVSLPDVSTYAMTASLRLVGWNGTQWVDLSGGPNATSNVENSILAGTMIAGITAIGIGSIDPPLAVDQVSFTYSPRNCAVDLQWRMVNAADIESFIIERSTDGSRYEVVTEVPSARSDKDTIYHLEVPQEDPVVYYRLRFMHRDGSYTYSKVIVGRTDCLRIEEIVLYPNPVSGSETLYLSVTSNYKGTLKLIFTNIPGQKLMQQHEKVYGGKTLIPINTSRFAQGVYFLNVLTNEDQPLKTGMKFTIAN